VSRVAATPIVLLALVALSPLVALLVRGAREIGSLSGLLPTTLVTLGLALAGTALSLLAGGGLAWLAFRAGLGTRWDLAVLPAYLLPSFVAALGWIFALEPLRVRPYGPIWILAVWTATYAPLAYLLVRPALERTIPRLALASWIHGIHGIRSLRTLLPPLFLPLGSVAGIIYLALLGNFGVPQILGAPVGTATLATAAYARLLSPVRSDPLGDAAAVGLILAVLSVPALGGRLRQAELGSLQALPRAHPLAARLCLLAFGCVAFGIPLIGLLRVALFNPYTGAFAPQFAAAFSYPLVRSGIVHSFALATLAALILLAGATALAPFGGALRLLRRSLDPNYLLPGTMLGLGLIFLLARTPLYATPLILLLAYALHFAPLALRSVEAGAGGIDALVFAARVHGVSAPRAWARIGFPLLRPYLGAAAFMIFPLAFSELTLSALLYAPGSETLGVAVLSALNDGLYGQGAALGLLALAVALTALILPRRVTG
jgi:iron(III) transport system permease protein